STSCSCSSSHRRKTRRTATMTLHDRDTRKVNRVERFVGNKVVAHVMHIATIRGAISLSQLWAEFNNGLFAVDEMKEFYQLLGVPLNTYAAVFNETFELEHSGKTPEKTTGKV